MINAGLWVECVKCIAKVAAFDHREGVLLRKLASLKWHQTADGHWLCRACSEGVKGAVSTAEATSQPA
jgi:hypothetical protein